MSADTSLYGVKSASSTKSKPISTNNSLAFTSSLSSLISRPQLSRGSFRKPEKKAKEDLFARPVKKQKRADSSTYDQDGNSGHVQDIGGVEDAILERSRRRMEKKAQLYKDLKKGYGAYAGEGEHGNGLVDFDQKWAKGEGGSSSEEMDDEATPAAANEVIEYTDEFGRVRKGTRAQQQQAQKAERLRQNISAEEEANSYQRPVNLIVGDTIQSLAFNPDDQIHSKMEAMAKKRDRSMTPPDDEHYDAKKEIRSKGVGFYAFSRDGKAREEEMENLKQDREMTEAVKKARRERIMLENEGDDLLRRLEKEAEVDTFLRDMEQEKSKEREPG